MKIVTQFPLNSNKTLLRHYSLRRPFACDFWGGVLGMEFSWGWNIFQKLLKGRVISEGINIFFENTTSPYRVNLCAPKTWLLQVVRKWHSWGEWTKARWNPLTSRFFPSCSHKYQLISSKFSVFNFLLWKHVLTKNEVNYILKWSRDHSCGKPLTHFSLYLYRISSFYFSCF